MVMLDEAACNGFFPNRKSGARRAPSLDDLPVGPCVRTNPFEEIENQSVNWVWHKFTKISRGLTKSSSATDGESERGKHGECSQKRSPRSQRVRRIAAC